ncbi:MAG: sodium ion-translocating decarboxylase subunit beta, partial [Clostridia bacterium]|nr:sodium ion-translocating decarboxylase subunit beta [Clostridia bacterium]
MLQSLANLVTESGFANILTSGDGWKNLIMIAIACVLLYLGIKKQYEPLLMVGIAMGCLLANVSALSKSDALYHQALWDAFLQEGGEFYHDYGHILAHGGLIDILYIGVKAGIYPCLIFIGIGAMTDFGPLISNPKSLLLGAAAQFGVFFAFLGANLLG